MKADTPVVDDSLPGSEQGTDVMPPWAAFSLFSDAWPDFEAPPLAGLTLPADGAFPALPVAFDSATLADMATDPCNAALLEKLRKNADETFCQMVDATCRQLTAAETPSASAGTATELRLLIAASRHKERQARQCRQLAEALVTGHIHNLGNPAWNPSDPASSSTQPENIFLTLLSGIKSAQVPSPKPIGQQHGG